MKKPAIQMRKRIGCRFLGLYVTAVTIHALILQKYHMTGQKIVHIILSSRLGETNNWISLLKSTASLQEDFPSVDVSLFTPTQQYAYDIIKNHALQSVDAYSESLKMIMNGEAGTGKSFLISAIRNLLHCQCYVIAATDKAAHNINGVTIHSLQKLQVNKQLNKGPCTRAAFLHFCMN